MHDDLWIDLKATRIKLSEMEAEHLKYKKYVALDENLYEKMTQSKGL